MRSEKPGRREERRIGDEAERRAQEHSVSPLWLGAEHVRGDFFWEDGTEWDYDNWFSGGHNVALGTQFCKPQGETEVVS